MPGRFRRGQAGLVSLDFIFFGLIALLTAYAFEISYLGNPVREADAAKAETSCAAYGGLAVVTVRRPGTGTYVSAKCADGTEFKWKEEESR